MLRLRKGSVMFHRSISVMKKLKTGETPMLGLWNPRRFCKGARSVQCAPARQRSSNGDEQREMLGS